MARPGAASRIDPIRPRSAIGAMPGCRGAPGAYAVSPRMSASRCAAVSCACIDSGTPGACPAMSGMETGGRSCPQVKSAASLPRFAAASSMARPTAPSASGSSPRLFANCSADPAMSPKPARALVFRRPSSSPNSSSAFADSSDMRSVESFRLSMLDLSVGRSSAPLFPNSAIAACACRAGSLMLWIPFAMRKNWSSGDSFWRSVIGTLMAASACTVSAEPSTSRFCIWDTADVTWSSELPDGSATACSRCKASMPMPVWSAMRVRLSAAPSTSRPKAITAPAPSPIPNRPSS